MKLKKKDDGSHVIAPTDNALEFLNLIGGQKEAPLVQEGNPFGLLYKGQIDGASLSMRHRGDDGVWKTFGHQWLYLDHLEALHAEIGRTIETLKAKKVA